MSVKEQWVFGNQCLEVVNSHIYLVFVFSTFDVATNGDHLIRARHGTFEITKTLRKLGCSSPSLFFKTSWGTDSCPLFSMALNCAESRPVIQSKKFIYKAVSCFSMYRPPPPPHPPPPVSWCTANWEESLCLYKLQLDVCNIGSIYDDSLHAVIPEKHILYGLQERNSKAKARGLPC